MLKDFCARKINARVYKRDERIESHLEISSKGEGDYRTGTTTLLDQFM